MRVWGKRGKEGAADVRGAHGGREGEAVSERERRKLESLLRAIEGKEKKTKRPKADDDVDKNRGDPSLESASVLHGRCSEEDTIMPSHHEEEVESVVVAGEGEHSIEGHDKKVETEQKLGNR